jgi:hypothetical protein
VLIAGLAGLAAVAMSMAAGAYATVSSRRDAERTDLARERRELAASPKAELEELTRIHVDRGLAQWPRLRRWARCLAATPGGSNAWGRGREHPLPVASPPPPIADGTRPLGEVSGDKAGRQ